MAVAQVMALYGYSRNGIGVYAKSISYTGVYAESDSNYGISARNNNGSWGLVSYGGYAGAYTSGASYGTYGTGGSYGVWGNSSGGVGIYGNSTNYYGMYAKSVSFPAVYATSTNHYALEGHSSATWAAALYGVMGVYGEGTISYGMYGTSTSGYGAYFYSGSSYGMRAATGRGDKNWAGVFDGNIYCYGAYQSSDRNLKKNVADFSGALDIINKLKPKSYEFRTDEKIARMHLPGGIHYGLIAQDVEQILPNLVKEVDADVRKEKVTPKPTAGIQQAEAVIPGAKTPVMPAKNAAPQPTEAALVNSDITETMTVKSVNYIELIPLLIKAMQEQQQEIQELRKQVDKLQSPQKFNTPTMDTKSSAVISKTYFSPTKVSYTLPVGYKKAELLITDNVGRKLQVMPLSNAGLVSINTATLSAGVYNYTIVVDDKVLESKMVPVIR